jgi:UPF0755 protein
VAFEGSAMLWRRRKGVAEEFNIEKPADRMPEPDLRDYDPPPRTVGGRRMTPKSPRAALEPERIPVPRRSSGARHPMVVAGNAVFTILIILAIVIGGAVLIGKNRLEASGPLPDDKIVNIPRSGVRDVAESLEREGVINQPWIFIGAVILQKARGDLKSGEYQFTRNASLQDVINTIIEGKVVQHAITIPEGLTSQQIVQRLLDTDILAGNIREIPREGSLMPETYRVQRGMPREQLIQRMQQAQRRVLQEAWERRAPDLPIKSPDDLLTLASIVEKETGKSDERTRVAAVFVNRIKQRMRLQSDPTIIYGLVGGKGTLGRPILRSEITMPTPYNTYVIDGLPPGPIANPGRASIEATANPARTKELFFVADGSGGHTFSETLDQHQRGVQRLRALEQQMNDSSVAASADQPPEGAPQQQQPPQQRPRAVRPAPPPAAAQAPPSGPRQLAPPTQTLQNPAPTAATQNPARQRQQ